MKELLLPGNTTILGYSHQGVSLTKSNEGRPP